MSESGVLFNAPSPGPIMDAANRLALDAAEKLPINAQGGVFAIATTKGVNAVIVHKVNEHFRVAGYVGKRWGQPFEAGASAVLVW
jgi:hypothetical protein